MKEELHYKPKNQFQLELEAKMKERRSRGLTSALSPSPTEMNQTSTVGHDYDDILSSFHPKSFQSASNYKTKWNSSDLNKTMQWGDSKLHNSSFLDMDDDNSLGFRNRKSPSWKESPRSGDSQKSYSKSPRNSLEADFSQSETSYRNRDLISSKFDLKDSPRGGYRSERKPNSSLDNYINDSPHSAGSATDHILSSQSEAKSSTSVSSGQRFLKSSKKSSINFEKDEEGTIQEKNSPRPTPRVRKKSPTSSNSKEQPTEKPSPSITNDNFSSQNSELSSARLRRHNFKTKSSSPVLEDSLSTSFGKNSSSTVDRKKAESPRFSDSKVPSPRETSREEATNLTTNRLERRNSKDPVKELFETKEDPLSSEMKKTAKVDQRKADTPKSPVGKVSSPREAPREEPTNLTTNRLERKNSKDLVKELFETKEDPLSSDVKRTAKVDQRKADTPKFSSPREEATSKLERKNSKDPIKDLFESKEDPSSGSLGSEMKRTAKEILGKSVSFEKQSFAATKDKPMDDKLDNIKPSFSRQESQRNETDKNGHKSKSDCDARISSPQKMSTFDFLTKDVELEDTKNKQKSPEKYSQSTTNFKDLNAEGNGLPETSSLCEDLSTEFRPMPIPRKNKSQEIPKTERQLYEEAIQQVEDSQKSETLLFLNKIDKDSEICKKSPSKPLSPNKSTSDVGTTSSKTLDPKALREEIFQEWKTQKNRIIKEQKRKQMELEEKQKKELEEKRRDAEKSFESWKKQKEPLLKQKLKIEKTKQVEEFEKQQKQLQRKQDVQRSYEMWKKEKDKFLKSQSLKQKEKEKKMKQLLNTNKDEKQKQNISSFNTWKKLKDQILLEKKKEEMKTTKIIQKQMNYDKIQKETICEESYQQWLLKKAEQEKAETRKRKELRILESFIYEPQVWRPPSRTIPLSR